MATEQQAQGQGGAFEPLSFSHFFNKEFKPRSDAAKEAVETAVRTLAEQALAQTTLISADAIGTIEAIIAALDRKLSEQVNLIMHHKDFQELESAWRGLHYLGDQHRDRRDAEDPRAQHLQGGPRQDAEALQGRGLGPEPDLQEGLRGRVRAVRRRALRLPGRRLLLRSQPAGRRSCWARWRRMAAASHCPFIAGVSPDRHADGELAGAGESARPHQDLHDAGVRAVAVAARVG